MKNKGQSEMAGFAIIVVIVTVLLMVFLSFSINDKNEKGELASHKIQSFISAFTESTTTCEGSRSEDFLSMQKLISKCNTESFCHNGTNACEIMNETINEIMESSWRVGENYPIKGYILELLYEEDEGGELLVKSAGIETKNREGGRLKFPSDDLLIQLTIYS